MPKYLLSLQGEDGEVVKKDPHPVQCECTKHAFYLGLMSARKSTRIYHSDWHFGKEDDSITPLGAVVYTRGLFTFQDMSLTALDFGDDASTRNFGINMPIITDGKRSLEPANESDSDDESYYSCSSQRASLAGSYQQARSNDRKYITGATAPSNLQIKDKESPRKEQRPVQQVKEIINLFQTQLNVYGEAFRQLRNHDLDSIDDGSAVDGVGIG